MFFVAASRVAAFSFCGKGRQQPQSLWLLWQEARGTADRGTIIQAYIEDEPGRIIDAEEEARKQAEITAKKAAEKRKEEEY